MHPLTDQLPDYLDANALRQACGKIEAGLRVELAQASNEAWDAAYQQARSEWAVVEQAVVSLKDAFEHLLERCDTSDDFRYGTLSTTFVREICSAALEATR